MNNKNKGFKSMAIGLVWALIVIGGVLAILQVLNIGDAESGLAYIREKSIYYVECIPNGTCGLGKIAGDISSGINGGSEVPPSEPGDTGSYGPTLDRETTPGYEGPAKGIPYINDSGLIAKETAKGILEDLQTVPANEDDEKEVGYSRKEWKHWTGTEGQSCWNTREYILYRDAVPGTVVMIDKKKNPTTNYDEACAIGTIIEKDGKATVDSTNSGEWIDPYSGDIITDASKIDIDHVIPLSNAARNGGQEWSSEKKEQFANDPENLLATSAKENRSKGDKGPAKYMPLQKSGYKCAYAKTYVSLSNKYELTITDADYKVLEKAILSCPN